MTLSDKRFQTEAEFFKDMRQVLYEEEDVKEFIRKLKVGLRKDIDLIYLSDQQIIAIDNIIDGLAGDKLI